MNRFTRLAWLVCLGLMTAAVSRPAVAATAEERITARLDALERENAALRARLNQIEASKAAKPQHRPADMEPRGALASVSRPLKAESLDVVGIRRPDPPRFEVSGSLMFLQPGAGNLEYGTLVSPLPAPTPHWNNQSLRPNFSPAFSIGARYIASESNDFQLNWTHHNATSNASVFAAPDQMVGPPYLIGPESGLYKNGQGSVRTAYDAINLDAGHTFCVECAFQLRAFGGIEVARIGQNLSGLFQDPPGTASSAYTVTSLFTGAGPRLGVKGQYALGDFQLIGEMATAALIGSGHSRIDFTTTSPAFGLNTQSLTSPNATQVVPSIDARLATAYTFAPSTYGLFRVEAGYRAAVYFNAVNQYALTQVPTSLTLPPIGIYLATAQHLQSNFTDHGPYVTASWSFW